MIFVFFIWNWWVHPTVTAFDRENYTPLELGGNPISDKPMFDGPWLQILTTMAPSDAGRKQNHRSWMGVH